MGISWIWDEGLEPISLTGSGDIQEVKLTTKGEVVVFTRETQTGTVTLWAISADGSALRSLTPGAILTGSVEMLSFSGDESQLAFTHKLTDNAGELWVVNLDGTGARRLVSQEDLMTIVAEPQAVGALACRRDVDPLTRRSSPMQPTRPLPGKGSTSTCRTGSGMSARLMA